jgi:hypothetical protein
MWPSLAQLRSCSVNPVSSGLIWIEINFDLYRIYFSLITQIQKGFDVTEHALNLSERSCSCVTLFAQLKNAIHLLGSYYSVSNVIYTAV